jgi:hypothetical protein
MALMDTYGLARVLVDQMLRDPSITYFVRVCDQIRARFLINLVVVSSADEDAQIMHVRELIGSN